MRLALEKGRARKANRAGDLRHLPPRERRQLSAAVAVARRELRAVRTLQNQRGNASIATISVYYDNGGCLKGSKCDFVHEPANIKKRWSQCYGLLTDLHEEKEVDGKKVLVCPKQRRRADVTSDAESAVGSDGASSPVSLKGKKPKGEGGKGKARRGKSDDNLSDMSPSDSVSQV